MAEIILTPIVEQIIGKLGSIALEQVLHLRSLKPEIMKLKDTVESIQAVLLDAEEKQSHNHQIKLWLDRLSDVMYDADDLLDDFSTEAALRQQAAAAGRAAMATTCWSSVCSRVSSLHKQLTYDFKMARAIKAIREQLDFISKEKEAFKLASRAEDKALPSRETDACPPTIVVGRKDDKKNIIRLLLNSNSEANISVVSIVAMGGLGKTTLAQLVFDDEQVNAHFDVKAWVYVSQSFHVNVILGKMLRSIDRQSQTGLELDELQVQLREKIKGKKFLFVLDDVWEESNRSWETLGKYLTVGAPGSKVLVTTRSTTVAEVGGRALKSRTSTTIVEPYCLKGLSEDECWTLLVEKTLPRKVPQDQKVQNIGKQILGQCGGVPLAVSTIAGVLADLTDPEMEWPSFLEKGLSSIMKEGEEDPTMSTLRLSFNHLPSHMKHCFTYCNLFPKGFRFDIQMLVRLWVAQRYIESEDRGYACFKTLWWRSFFQEVKMDKSGNLSTCRMHDLMHELADSIAGENIISSSSSTVLRNVPSKTRHLSILDDLIEEYYGDGMGNASKVRTLIFFKSPSNKELDQVLNNFLRLRVLMIVEQVSTSGLDHPTVLNSVGKLKHLRCLALVNARWKRLPDSVSNLVNLQVLKLVNVWSLEERPRDVKTLVNLMHLELNVYEGVKLPNWLYGLKKLVELSLEDCKQCEYLPPLHHMSSLKKLSVKNCPLLKGIKNDDSGHCDSSPENSTRRSIPEDGEWPRFQCLAHLCIEDCPRLTRLPTFPIVEGKLKWVNLSLEPLAKTMKIKMPMRRGGGGGVVTNVHPYSSSSSSSSALVHPLSKLTKLTLQTIDDDLESLSCRDSSSCLVSLHKLKVGSCSRGVKLPGSLCSSVYLMKIYISQCEMVEYLPSLHELPSLRELCIMFCPKLKGCWWKKKKQQSNNDTSDKDGGDDDYYNFDPSISMEGAKDEDEEEWPHFLCLSTLSIVGCPKLTRMPLFPTVEGELKLRSTSAEALVRTMKMKPIVASSSSLMGTAIVTPLSKLKQLDLWGIEDLEYLPEEGFRNLTSLRELQIMDCERLARLPRAIRHLTSLQFFSFSKGPLLIERCRRREGEDWPNVSNIPKMVIL